MPAPHTPTPWSVFIMGDTVAIDIGAKHNGRKPNIVNWTGFDSCDLPLEERKANARHIVHCVNTHAALVEALRALTPLVDRAVKMSGHMPGNPFVKMQSIIATALQPQP